jgi:hypothetical protein
VTALERLGRFMYQHRHRFHVLVNEFDPDECEDGKTLYAVSVELEVAIDRETADEAAEFYDECLLELYRAVDDEIVNEFLEELNAGEGLS